MFLGDNRIERESFGKVPLCKLQGRLLIVLLNKPSSLLGKYSFDTGCRERSDRCLLIG